jgi:hypothetical protein
MDREGLKALLLLAAESTEYAARARRAGGEPPTPEEIAEKLKADLEATEGPEALEASVYPECNL